MRFRVFLELVCMAFCAANIYISTADINLTVAVWCLFVALWQPR